MIARVGVVLSLAAVLVGLVPECSAITAPLTGTSPNNNNTSGGQVSHRMRANSNGVHNDVQLLALFDAQVGGTVTFTKQEKPSDVCDRSLRQGVPGSVAVVTLTIAGTIAHNISANDLCTNSGLFRSFAIPRNAMTFDDNTGKYKATITIAYTPTALSSYLNINSPDNYIGFVATVTASGGSGVIVGPLGSGSRDYSLQSNQSSGSRTITVPFGFACHDEGRNDAQLKIYDADMGTYGPMTVSVYKWGTDERVRLRPGNLVTITDGGYAAVPLSTNRENSLIVFDMKPHERYVLQVRDIEGSNTFDIGLPNGSSAAFGALPCWNLEPHSSVQPEARPGTRVQWTHTVKNAYANGDTARVGTTIKWGKEGARTSGTAGSDPGVVDYGPGETRTFRRSFTIPSDTPLGTRYCQYAEVAQESSTNNRPRDSWGDRACVRVVANPAIPGPSPRAFDIIPRVTASADEPEPGETANFVGAVRVNAFPDDIEDWGYTEVAQRRAVNLVSDGIASARPQLETYAPQQSSQSTSRGTPQVQCGDGVYRGSCVSQYRCQDGVSRPSCSNYRWRCVNGTEIWPEAGYWPRSDAPNCFLEDWKCWDGTVVATQHFRPGALCNRWKCLQPSQEGPFNNTNAPPGDYACKVFRCAAYSPAGVVLPRAASGGQIFYSAALNLHDPNDNNYPTNAGGNAILRDAGCAMLCNGGNGPDTPPLLDSAHSWDRNCYQRPWFAMQCVFTVNGRMVAAPVVRVDRSGEYCSTNLSGTGAAPGDRICAVANAVDPGLPAGWNHPAPGFAIDRNQYVWDNTAIRPDEKCITVVAKPIVQAFGGDVAVGQGLAVNGVCSQAASHIVAWPRGIGRGYTAAGTQLGTFSSGRTDGFSSAMARGLAAAPPNGFTFGSNGIGANGQAEDFGGNYAIGTCIPDRYSGVSSITDSSVRGNLSAAITSSPAEGGSYKVSSGHLGGGTLPKSKKLTLYIDGDVVINADIGYDRSGWGSINEIPALAVVASGNIYINKSVGTLSGLYAAGGDIYTCTNDSRPITGIARWSECRDKELTVYGSLVARKVILGRSSGTAIQNGPPGERFVYLPELWQAQSKKPDPNTNIIYNSIVSLPPVL